MQLRSFASIWWNMELEHLGLHISQVTWELFIERFRERFMSEYWQKTRSEEFFKISQGNSTVEIYKRKFFQLKKYSSWNEGDKTLVQHFIRGLNPRIGEEVRTFKPKNVKEVADQAKLAEMKFGFSTKNADNPSVPSSSKNQKSFKDDSKSTPSGYGSKSLKRKFNKFTKSDKGFKVPELPKSIKPAKSVKQSFALS